MVFAKDIIRACINTFKVLPNEITSLCELGADHSLLQDLLNKLIKGCNVILSENALLNILKGHFTNQDLIKYNNLKDESEITILLLLILYITVITNGELREKLCHSTDLSISTQSMVKHLLEMLQKRGSDITRKYLEVLINEDLDIHDKSTSMESCTPRRRLLSSPHIYTSSPNARTSQSPLKDLITSPTFKMQNFINIKEKELKNLRLRINELEDEQQNLEHTVKRLTNSSSKKDDEISKLKKQLKSLMDEKEQLQTNVTSSEDFIIRQKHSIESELKRIQKENEEHEKNNLQLQDDNQELNSKIKCLHAKLSKTRDEKEMMENELSVLNRQKLEQELIIDTRTNELHEIKVQLHQLQDIIAHQSRNMTPRSIDYSFESVPFMMEVSCSTPLKRIKEEEPMEQGENMAEVVVDKLLQESKAQINDLTNKNGQLAEKLKLATATKDDFAQKIADIEGTLRKTLEEKETYLNEIKQKTEAHSVLENENANLNCTLQKTTAELSSLNAAKQHLEITINECNKKISMLQEENETINTNMEQKTKEFTVYKNEIETKISHIEQQCEIKSTALSSCEEQIRTLNMELLKTKEDLEINLTSKMSLEIEVKQHEMQILTLKEEKDNINLTLSQTQEEFSAYKSNSENQFRNIKHEFNLKNEAFNDVKEQCESLNNELLKTQNDLKDVTSNKESLEISLKEVTCQKISLEEKGQQLHANLIQTHEEYQSFKGDAENKLKVSEEELRLNKVALNVAEQRNNDLDNTLSETKEELKVANENLVQITEEFNTFKTNAENEISTIKHEYDLKNEAIKAIEEEKNEINIQLLGAKTQLDIVNATNAAFEAKINENNSKIAELTAERENLNVNIVKQAQEYTEYKNNVESKVKELEQELDKKIEAVNVVEKENKELSISLLKTKEELEHINVTIKDCNIQISTLMEEKQKIESNLNQQTMEFSSYKTTSENKIQESDSMISALKEEKQNLSSNLVLKNEEFQTLKSNLEDKLQHLEREFNLKNEALKLIEEEKQEITINLHNTKEELKLANTVKDTLEALIKDYDIKISTLRTENDNITTSLTHKTEEYIKQKTDFEAKIMNMEQELVQENQLKESLKKELTSVKSQSQVEGHKLAQHQESFTSLNLKYESLQNDYSGIQVENSKLQKQVNEAATAKNTLLAKNNEVMEQLKTVSIEKKALQTALEQKTVASETFENENRILNNKLVKTEVENHLLNSTIKALELAIKENGIRTSKLEEEKENIEKTLDRTSQEFQSYKDDMGNKINTLKSNVEIRNKEYKKLCDELAIFNTKYETLEKNYSDANNETTKLKQELEEYLSVKMDLLQKISEFEGNLKQLGEKNDKLVEEISDKNNICNVLEKENKSLNDNLLQIIVKLNIDAQSTSPDVLIQECNSKLKSLMEEKEQLSNMLTSKVEEFKTYKNNIEKEIEISKSNADLKNHEHSQIIEEFSKCKLELTDYVKNFETMKEDLNRKEEMLKKYTEELTTATAEFAKLETNQSSLAEENSTLKKQVEDYNTSNNKLNSEVNGLKEELKQLMNQNTELTTVFNEMECNHKDSLAKVNELSALLASTESNLANVQSDYSNLEKLYEENKSLTEQLVQEKTNLENGNLKSEEAYQGRESKLNEKLNSVQQSLNEKQEEYKSLADKFQTVQNDLIAQISDLTSEKESFLKERYDLKNVLEDKEATIHDLNEQHSLLKAEKANLDVKIITITESLDSKTQDCEKMIKYNSEIKAKLKEVTEAFIIKERTLGFSKAILENFKDDVTHMKKSLEKASPRTTPRSSRLSEIEKALNDNSKETQDHKENALKLKEELKSLESTYFHNLNALKEELSIMKSEVKKAKNLEQKCKTEFKRLREEFQGQDAKIFKEKYDTAKIKLMESMNELKSVKEAKEQYEKQMSTYKERYSKLSAEYSKEQSKFKESGKKMAYLEERDQSLRTKLSDYQMQIKKLSSEKASIEAQLSYASTQLREKDKKSNLNLASKDLDVPKMGAPSISDSRLHQQRRMSTRSSNVLKEYNSRELPSRRQSTSSLKTQSSSMTRFASATKIEKSEPKSAVNKPVIKVDPSESTTSNPAFERSVPRNMTTLFNCVDEEEEDMFNPKYLQDFNNGKCIVPSARVSELVRRNSLYPPHMRSSYAPELTYEISPETNLVDLQDEDIEWLEVSEATRKLDINSPDSYNLRKRKSNSSLASSGSFESFTSKKCKRLSTSYSRPGPPTPGGKSLSNDKENRRESLRSRSSIGSNSTIQRVLRSNTPGSNCKVPATPKNKDSPSALSMRSGKGHTPLNKKKRTPSSIRKIIATAKSPFTRRDRPDENIAKGTKGLYRKKQIQFQT